jgi:hypothetical protein
MTGEKTFLQGHLHVHEQDDMVGKNFKRPRGHEDVAEASPKP